MELRSRTALLGLTLLALSSVGVAACGDGSTPPGIDGGRSDLGTSDLGTADLGGLDLGGPDQGPISCVDADGDGVADVACGGEDCDDTDANRYPGNAEDCNNRDEDCNPTTLGNDRDGDGFVDSDCCNPDSEGVLQCGFDCDDAMAGIAPGQPESCNGFDDDCNGAIDDGVLLTFYRDVDSDGYGITTDSTMGCSVPTGYALQPGDCDDTRGSVNPPATESCATVYDDNCRDGANEGCLCLDTGPPRTCGATDAAGAFITAGECRTGLQSCSGGRYDLCVGAREPETEICNMLDDDCDGTTDEGADVGCYSDADNDSYAPRAAAIVRACPSADPAREPFGFCPFGSTSRVPTATVFDCADTGTNAININPRGVEVCNDLDDDCNGMIDDGSGRKRACYVDADGDDYAASTTGATMACVCPPRTTTRAPLTTSTTDCDDSRITVNPIAAEICDAAMPARDENCSGMANEGCACVPPESRPCPQPGVCGTGTQTCTSTPGGSVWGICTRAPSDETCNALDDDCDASIDETFACIQGSAATPCTTGCGTVGASACLGSCSRDVCRAAAESCNFCDDDADGLGDDVEGPVTTSSISTTLCSGYTRGGSATGCYMVNGDTYDYGSLTLPGTVNVGYGSVTFRAELTLVDVVDGVLPSSFIDLTIQNRSCVGVCRFRGYRARWTFSWSGEIDRFELLELNSFAAPFERVLASSSPVAPPFDRFDSDTYFAGGTARRMELVFTPPVGAAPGSLVFRDARAGLTLVEASLPTAVIGPGTAVQAFVATDTEAGAVSTFLGTGAASTFLTALRTCP